MTTDTLLPVADNTSLYFSANVAAVNAVSEFDFDEWIVESA